MPPKSGEGKLWTTAEVALLVSLKSFGLTWFEIADRIPDRTTVACERKWDRLTDAERYPKGYSPPR